MEKMTIIQGCLLAGSWKPAVCRPLVFTETAGLRYDYRFDSGSSGTGSRDRSNHQLSLPWVYVCRRKYAG